MNKLRDAMEFSHKEVEVFASHLCTYVYLNYTSQIQTWKQLYERIHCIEILSVDYNIFSPQIYPLWFCPVITPEDPNCAHYMDHQMYIDIGIYGESPKIDGFDYVDTTRKFEKFTLVNKG